MKNRWLLVSAANRTVRRMVCVSLGGICLVFLATMPVAFAEEFPEALKPSEVDRAAFENMTQAQINRRLDDLARLLSGLERKLERLDERVDNLALDIKEVKRKL